MEVRVDGVPRVRVGRVVSVGETTVELRWFYDRQDRPNGLVLRERQLVLGEPSKKGTVSLETVVRRVKVGEMHKDSPSTCDYIWVTTLCDMERFDHSAAITDE